MKGLEDALTSALSKISGEERKMRRSVDNLGGIEEHSGLLSALGQANASEPVTVSLPVVIAEDSERTEPQPKTTSRNQGKKKSSRKPRKVVLRPGDFRVRLVKGLPQSQ